MFDNYELKFFLECTFNQDYDPDLFSTYEKMLFSEKNISKRNLVKNNLPKWENMLLAKELNQLFNHVDLGNLDLDNTTAVLKFIF